MTNHGPNVTRLILKFVPVVAIPKGSGKDSLAKGLKFFQDPQARKTILEEAERRALESIQLVQSAPDNPYGDDDERIALEILDRLQEKQGYHRDDTISHQ